MKTAIVTGASKGVGYATVKLLSENGYKVIAVSRNLEKVSELISDNVEIYQLDITNENEIKKFYEKYKDISLDLLVNNAGGGSGPTNLINETMDNFRIAYEINVSGPMYLSQLFVPCMKRSKSPTIIFISSLGGKVPYRGGGNYTNAKRGQMGLIDTMRMEFPEYGIKITEICPGTIDTQVEKRDIALTAEDLANSILWVSQLPSHLNINHIEMNHISSSKFA
ncbi:MAG: SDR family oxidoreductase [Chitinophagia bacterium]|jgi:3-hydroxy acid dehydrogenase/malonic semialdehyde reductase|nr:SDR family oxidoreductase [Chitinophagia bacterium]